MEWKKQNLRSTFEFVWELEIVLKTYRKNTDGKWFVPIAVCSIPKAIEWIKKEFGKFTKLFQIIERLKLMEDQAQNQWMKFF